jgi:hypothetical protein
MSAREPIMTESPLKCIVHKLIAIFDTFNPFNTFNPRSLTYPEILLNIVILGNYDAVASN